MQRQYIIRAYDIILYCKVISFPKYGGGINYSLSFGGKHNFCITAHISEYISTSCYIDHIEYNESYIKDGLLEENSDIITLVKTVLWTIVNLFPNIISIELKDNLYICCENKLEQHMINLTCEYILKYNMTWYEKHFNATICDKDSYNMYRKTLNTLDMPLDNIEFILSLRPELEKYREIYISSSTPRDFINNIQKSYSETYYIETGEWIPYYLRLLRISYYCEMWNIDKNNITKPYNYSIETTNMVFEKEDIKSTQKKNYRLTTSYNEHGSCMGYYDTFE